MIAISGIGLAAIHSPRFIPISRQSVLSIHTSTTLLSTTLDTADRLSMPVSSTARAPTVGVQRSVTISLAVLLVSLPLAHQPPLLFRNSRSTGNNTHARTNASSMNTRSLMACRLAQPQSQSSRPLPAD